MGQLWFAIAAEKRIGLMVYGYIGRCTKEVMVSCFIVVIIMQRRAVLCAVVNEVESER